MKFNKKQIACIESFFSKDGEKTLENFMSSMEIPDIVVELVQCSATTLKGKQCSKTSKILINGLCPTHSKNLSESDSEKSVESNQCSATTKKGNRCSKKSRSLNGLCSIHSKNLSESDSEKSIISDTESVQCSATTKKGKQCSKKIRQENGLCVIHTKAERGLHSDLSDEFVSDADISDDDGQITSEDVGKFINMC
jgi:hypothetical protein